MSVEPPILLIESDPHFARALARELHAEGYRVELAHSCEQARARVSLEAPRLLLAGQLPGQQLPGLLAWIHARAELAGAAPAVLVLGAEAGGLEVLRAFEAGADDFMARPLNYLELRARLRALLRRIPAGTGATSLELDELQIDLQTRLVSTHGRQLELTRIEFELLVHLARAPQRVFTRPELLRAVWGFRCTEATRTLDTHASRLRGKLNAASSRKWIVAVRGVGYRLI